MSRLILKSVANLAGEPVELYWFAGLTKQGRDAWFVRAVFRGTTTGQFHLKALPIGLLPVLTLGSVFEHGERKVEPFRGTQATISIADLSEYEVITSADIPQHLYSFDGHPGGVQRLFRFRTALGILLIPAIEWIRYLFLHNRTLANTVMRPGALNLLFSPQAPGYQAERVIRFTSEMPERCLSDRFVKEFAWLALDSDARRAWDSVSLESINQAFVSFAPPALRYSTWRFRGIQEGDAWLVLELQHMTGRKVPCRSLEYSHPKLKRVIRVHREGGSKDPRGGGASGSRNDGEGKPELKYEVDDGQEGSQANSKLKSTPGLSKLLDFENEISVTAQRETTERESSGKPSNAPAPGGKPTGRTKNIKVSGGERAGSAKLPPIEFSLLDAAPTSRMGNLDALDETARHMRDQLPGVGFVMSLCQLKAGRAFSQIGREPRSAMVVVISRHAVAPIVLLDVERTGVLALSLVVLRFRSPVVDSRQIERVAKEMLDGLVDAGGHWSNKVEERLTSECTCERFPNLLIPRDMAKFRAKIWALRLIERLGLSS